MKWSHRKVQAYLEWMHRENNKPDRADHYVMALTAEVRRLLSRNPKAVKLEHFTLEFVKKRADGQLTAAEKKSKMSKSRTFWSSFLGMARKVLPKGDK